MPSSMWASSSAAATAPGATLEVRAGLGAKGPQVTEILSVDTSTAAQEPPERGRPERPISPSDNQSAVEEIGTVKWYNTAKGFGFIGSDRGGKDIFVHATVLNRAGLADLTEGQRVAVDVIDGRKGPEAASLRLIWRPPILSVTYPAAPSFFALVLLGAVFMLWTRGAMTENFGQESENLFQSGDPWSGTHRAHSDLSCDLIETFLRRSRLFGQLPGRVS
jgi:cold shock CspA family protein